MNNKTDAVIVLHGILRTNASMKALSSFLEKADYHVLNLDYPSRKYPLEQLADIIHPQINDFITPITGKVHFVGYSMGGLLIRAYLKKYKPASIGRVVMIGTPNQGSEVADFFKNFIIYKKISGPAGQQLITDQQSFKSIFSDINFELGIISGNKPFDFISSRIINKPNDGKVSVESSQMPGAQDNIILRCNHEFFPSNKIMHHQVLEFLQTGHFNHSD